MKAARQGGDRPEALSVSPAVRGNARRASPEAVSREVHHVNSDGAVRALLQECRSVHDDADRTLQNALARLLNNGLYRAVAGI